MKLKHLKYTDIFNIHMHGCNATLGETVTGIIEILLFHFYFRHRQDKFGLVSMFSLVVGSSPKIRKNPYLFFLNLNFGQFQRGP